MKYTRSKINIVKWAVLVSALGCLLVPKAPSVAAGQGPTGRPPASPPKPRQSPGNSKTPSKTPARPPAPVRNANAIRDGARKPTVAAEGTANNSNNAKAASAGTPIPTNPDADLLPPHTSYSFGSLENIQESRFREISDKRRAFVNVTGGVRDQITTKLRECGRLEIVKTAKEAEFAVTYETWSRYLPKTPMLRDFLNAPTNAPSPTLVLNVPTSAPTPDWLNAEEKTGGTLIITTRDPTENVPRTVWRREDTDELFKNAVDRLIERFISEFMELDILLPKDFLESESKRLNWELARSPRFYGPSDLRAESAPTPYVRQTAPPSLVGPSPFPTPPPEVVAKLGARLPPGSRPLATPVPVGRPVDQLPVYIPQPTPTPRLAPIFSAPASVDWPPLGRGLFNPDPSEKNPYRRLNTDGQFSEVLGKGKAFVNITGQAGDKITARLKEYGRLDIVSSALDAEFALHYFTWTDGSKGGTLIVTIRDPIERLPRILWRGNDYKSSNAFDKLVKSFISELKKLGG